MLEPSYDSMKSGYHGSPFKRKTIPTTWSAKYHNQGRLNPKEMSFIASNAQFDKEAKRLYTEYKRLHGMKLTPVEMKNPTRIKIKQRRYFNGFMKWLKANEPTRISPMLWMGYRGVKASTKPKGGARMSSSWVRGVKIIRKNTIQLDLGGKHPYTYGFATPKDLQKFLRCESIGQTINKCKKQGSCNGLIRRARR